MNERGTSGMVAIALCALVTGCAATAREVSPMVPASIAAPASETVSVKTLASGVQIYECRTTPNAPRFEWALKAPDAELVDDRGVKIGKHYAGPSWELNDGSKVVGEVKARADSPRPDAIPWLLLSAKSASGPGVFGQTKSIQRVDTVGGKAPATGCDQAQAGREIRVPYKATYYFYVARP